MFNSDYSEFINGPDKEKQSWQSKVIHVVCWIAMVAVATFLFWYQVIELLE